MKIAFEKDMTCDTPQIRIHNRELNEEVKTLKNRLTQMLNGDIMIETMQGIRMVPISDVVRIYAEEKKVLLQTEKETGRVKKRLYTIESELEEQGFVRISNSEIVNVRKIRRLDTSITGTIRLELSGGVITFVSRRNVTRIKKVLGI